MSPNQVTVDFNVYEARHFEKEQALLAISRLLEHLQADTPIPIELNKHFIKAFSKILEGKNADQALFINKPPGRIKLISQYKKEFEIYNLVKRYLSQPSLKNPHKKKSLEEACYDIEEELANRAKRSERLKARRIKDIYVKQRAYETEIKS